MERDEERFLRRAFELAEEARGEGNGPFGSLLVGPGGDVLAEDRNTTVTDGDITAHPELKLARWAARELDAGTAAGATMYTSCEPCGMCAGALARSGLGRVVYALSAGQLRDLQPGAARAAVRSEGPHLYDEARRVVEGYVP
ncbi:nucleoside deaminase [Streptomyces sp. CMB-StM0423]|uniref:nucleoside deaminase n=1 Tax=Streptomyces sp. CMB-StM0423 TaxID=2059884 RepID=UPI000C702DF5|nr:nucleoside deaminase [Streptomyces sp. CMB-StM0423]AUH44884.1 tRNA-specific adenosine deaminase [Streptomyces sp. CMB-StM0423]